jgi:hypothetical protein
LTKTLLQRKKPNIKQGLSVEKRQLLTAAFISALLFSAVAGAMSVNLATANPAPLFSFPTEPVMNLPTIIVTSPVQNQTYTSNEVQLTLTIIKPETWFAFDVFHHADHTPGTQTFVNITSIYYVLDDGERQNITVHDIASLFDTPPTLTLNLSTILPLTVGAHSIKVGLEVDSYYVVRYTYNLSDALSSVKLHSESDPVNFRVATELELQLDSSPILPISASTVTVAVGIGLLVYFKKRKK